MVLFTGVQHLCTFNVVSPLFITFCPNVWKALYTISMSIFVVLYWLPYSMDKFMFCIVPGPLQWIFHIGEEIVIAWTHVGWVWWMFQNLPLPAMQEIRDRSSQCDSLHCPEEWWDSVPLSVVIFSWALDEVELQECAVVSSIHQPPRTRVRKSCTMCHCSVM